MRGGGEVRVVLCIVHTYEDFGKPRGKVYMYIYILCPVLTLKANGRENAKRVAQMLDSYIYGERPELTIIH